MYKNYHGWVNPEDLTAMPQCIAQQDHATWLEAMTKCTKKRCTSHFGVICTHHQWLTALSCLSTEFSSDLLREYLPYCGRSVLAKAQLYHWTRNITGRSWFSDVGDANGLENLSPSSLLKGYAGIESLMHAPACLTRSQSVSSKEEFQHAVGSCSFTATAQHMGNAARPWEYSQTLRSMIALDFETAGYSITRGYLLPGEYYDKFCFCNVFTLDFDQEPCSGTGLDTTKERLWLNATCGPASLPDRWTDDLKMVGSTYIPAEHWKWPTCVMDMPSQVTGRADQCATDACELGSPDGYCNVKRTIDRACFCQDISYDSCGGSCHIFEGRIDYIQWLHSLCGNVQGWHGLPSNWRQLSNPTRLEMVPWRWSLKPESKTEETRQVCSSSQWKLASITLFNTTPLLLATFLSHMRAVRRITPCPNPESWFFVGITTAALQIFATFLNAFLVVAVPGYENVPLFGLVLLWGTMPRASWLMTIWPSIISPSRSITLSEVASALLGEVLVQCQSAPYIFLTINYGLEHNFYFRSLESTEGGSSAKVMYLGALIWLIGIAVSFWAAYLIFTLIGYRGANGPKPSGGKHIAPSITDELTPLIAQRDTSSAYHAPHGASAAVLISQFLLWSSQCLFWGGFISLSAEEYGFPNLPFRLGG